MRCFLAISLPAEIKAYLEDVILVAEKANRRHDIKWVEPENLHLTLGFIEEIGEANLEKLKNDLSRFQVVRNFFLTLDKLGLFPNNDNPRVIKVGLADIANDLAPINKFINKVFNENNLPVDAKPFSPHITLGRVKYPGARIRLNQTIEPLSFKVNSIDLIKSELTSTGPIYTKIQSYPS